MTRAVKKFIYGAFWLVLFGLLGWGIYSIYFKPEPSCSDGIQNQTEEGIDCGQICGKICLPDDLRPLQAVPPADLFQPDQEHLALLGRISNRNSSLAARKVNYEFILKTSDGRTLNLPGETYIYANESKYIGSFFPIKEYELKAEDIAGSELSLNVTQPEWVKVSDFEQPLVKIQNVITDIRPTDIHIYGRIANQGAALLRPVVVIALLKNDAGEVIGATGTIREELLPSGASDFDLIYPRLSGVNPALTDVYAYGLRP